MKPTYNEIGELIICEHCNSTKHNSDRCLLGLLKRNSKNTKKQRPSDNIAYKRITKEIYKHKKKMFNGKLDKMHVHSFTIDGLLLAREILRESLKG